MTTTQPELSHHNASSFGKFYYLTFVYRSFQQARNPPPNLSQPTFEDLTIDDNLSELQRVVRYVKSSIGLQR